MNLLELDSAFTPVVSENLNDENWPVRLAAVYLLMENSPDFRKITDKISKLDTSDLVRQMALTFANSYIK